MPERDGYPAGTPAWVDLAAPDIPAAAEFYKAVFGWESEEVGTVEETGGYRFFTNDGKHVAGVGPIQAEDQPPVWTTYVYVDDADATTEKIKAAGGQVFVEPFDVMQAGRMAIFADPTGAVCAVWQPGLHKGAQLVNEAGALGWNELTTPDPEAGKAFYGDVFGWTTDELDMGESGTYFTWLLGDQGIGGMMPMVGDMWDGIPPHWMVYFYTDDTDGTVEKAKAAGGANPVPPQDIPPGRFAVLSDPGGAHFTVMTPNPDFDPENL